MNVDSHVTISELKQESAFFESKGFNARPTNFSGTKFEDFVSDHQTVPRKETNDETLS